MRQSALAIMYLTLGGSLLSIASYDRMYWPYPVTILLFSFLLNWIAAEPIHWLVGIHQRAFALSSGFALTALLFEASGPVALIIGISTAAAVILVDYCKTSKDRLYDLATKTAAELAHHLGTGAVGALKVLRWEGRKMSHDTDNLEKLKFDLELQKFSWQKAVDIQRSTFFGKNLGIIITAIVSIAAVTVSYLQLTITSNNARNQLDSERLKNDRQFYLEVAKFLLDRQRQISTNDKDTVLYLRNVVVSSFPPELAIEIASRMRDGSNTAEVGRVWNDAVVTLRAMPRRPPER